MTSIAGSRHSAVATVEGHVYTMGHNDSRGGGGHGSPPMDASGQLGRGGDSSPGRVLGDLQVSEMLLLWRINWLTGLAETEHYASKGNSR